MGLGFLTSQQVQSGRRRSIKMKETQIITKKMRNENPMILKVLENHYTSMGHELENIREKIESSLSQLDMRIRLCEAHLTHIKSVVGSESSTPVTSPPPKPPLPPPPPPERPSSPPPLPESPVVEDGLMSELKRRLSHKKIEMEAHTV